MIALAHITFSKSFIKRLTRHIYVWITPYGFYQFNDTVTWEIIISVKRWEYQTGVVSEKTQQVLRSQTNLLILWIL